MNIESHFSPPEHVTNILRRLTENGHAAFLVGGCARDAVMGRCVHDWDVATSAMPADVARLFPKTVMTGEKFGTVTVIIEENIVEATTFRVEGEYLDSRRPNNVRFVENLYDDLSRRDFTMNAMAISVTRELIDPYGGIDDIKSRVIRCVGNPDTRFAEDALRMFRALRFRAEMGFHIEKETLRAIYSNADKARLISAERVRVELEKTLMSQRPEIAGEMIKIGLLSRYITGQGYNMDRLIKIREFPMELLVRWCAFCTILLKGRLIRSAKEFLQSMRIDGKIIKTCDSALSIPNFPDDSVGIKRLLFEHGEDATRCAAAIRDILCDEKNGSSLSGSPYMEGDHSPRCIKALAKTNEIIASGECFSLSKLAVSGDDLMKLGYSPGQKLGGMLNSLLDNVINRPEDNTHDILLRIALCNILLKNT